LTQVAVNPEVNLRPDFTVRLQYHKIGVAAFLRAHIFNRQGIFRPGCIFDFVKLEFDVFAIARPNLGNFKGIFFFRDNLYRLFDGISDKSPQANRTRNYGYEFFNITENLNLENRIRFIITMDLGRFFYLPSAIPFCIDSECDFSLAAGRDLSRVGDRRAPSAGFDSGNVQRCIPFILNHKFMHNGCTVNDRFKLPLCYRQKGRRRLCGIG
jgi:hypothetical protein